MPALPHGDRRARQKKISHGISTSNRGSISPEGPLSTRDHHDRDRGHDDDFEPKQRFGDGEHDHHGAHKDDDDDDDDEDGDDEDSNHVHFSGSDHDGGDGNDNTQNVGTGGDGLGASDTSIAISSAAEATTISATTATVTSQIVTTSVITSTAVVSPAAPTSIVTPAVPEAASTSTTLSPSASILTPATPETTSVLSPILDSTPSSIIPATGSVLISAISNQPMVTQVQAQPVLAPLTSSTSVPSLTSAPAGVVPFPPPPSNSNKGNDDDHHHHDDHHDEHLDPNVRGVLIAIGSIGAIIILCFLGFLLYRTLKKSQRFKDRFGENRFYKKLFPGDRSNKLSFNSTNSFQRGTIRRTAGGASEFPPSYDLSTANQQQNPGFYFQEKSFIPGQYGQGNHQSLPLPEQDVNGWWRQQQQLQQNAGAAQAPPQQVNYFLPSQQQYPPDQETLSGDFQSTLRSRMPDPYYNQSELARQPSNARDPTRQQVYRASELSSISSGWGDGDDIIIPQSQQEYVTTTTALAPPKTPKPAAAAPARASDLRFSSWSSRRGSNARDRDTVYTTTSEDRPARFRTIHSWVAQQKGRAKRADSRARERNEVPVMPAAPGQMNVTQQTAYR